MRVLHVVSEAVPFIKTGGLADVAGALPQALSRLGLDCRTVLPLYQVVADNPVLVESHGLRPTGTPLSVPQPDGTTASVPVWRAGPKGDIWLLEYPPYWDRLGPYGDEGGDYPDNLQRFSFLCRAALALCQAQRWIPDLIHCHDWQTALLPVYLRHCPERYPELAATRTVLTIHNLSYQGLFDASLWPQLMLPDHLYQPDGLEFYHQINLLKGGILAADAITTVSRSYAEEIQQAEFGCGLEGVLRDRSDDLFGIINGIDTALWDPRTDPALSQSFDAKQITGRATNREAITRRFGLDPKRGPLYGMVGRLVEQKGIDLVTGVVDSIVQSGATLAVLGTGDPDHVAALQQAAKEHPDHIAIIVDFDDTLGRQIYAGCDLFLMPSRFEPCGLSQLIAMRYGAPPVVHRIGGLADTVAAFEDHPDSATGFAFSEYSTDQLIACMDRANRCYRDADAFTRVQQNGMAQEASWGQAAKQYQNCYDQLFGTEAPR